ncbi:DUF3800 domain-containing protein [Planomonospora corallina]|uniref:DUF3800 domain-containing protein n=1 Tax=Planomonospora corallina TaxID=1806052 RepID=A0ABV8IFR7_9ACTN
MYVDEMGNMDMSGGDGASRYFGFGTAVFRGEHGREMWEGLRLRCDLERRGVNLPRGLHAKDDSHATRDEVFHLIGRQRPCLDVTFLCKAKAHPAIRERPHWLCTLAWYSHFKGVLRKVSRPGDTVYVIAATLTTNRRTMNAKEALEEVCGRFAVSREIALCVRDAQSAWGIQVADYGLWAVQRRLEGRQCKWFDSQVKPNLRSMFLPWGTHD